MPELIAGIVISGPVLAVGLLVGLAAGVMWLAALVSVLVHDEFRYASQLIWVLVILLGGPVGAVVYFVLSRQRGFSTTEPVPDRNVRTQAIANPWSDS